MINLTIQEKDIDVNLILSVWNIFWKKKNRGRAVFHFMALLLERFGQKTNAIPKHLLFYIPSVQRGVVHTSYLLAQFKYFAVFCCFCKCFLIFMLFKPSGWLSPDVEVKVNEETEARMTPIYAHIFIFTGPHHKFSFQSKVLLHNNTTKEIHQQSNFPHNSAV